MTTALQRLQLALPPLAGTLAALSLGGGLYGILDPLAFSESLGLPVVNKASEALPFVSFIGARNVSGGLTVITLLYTSQRKALGLFFMCGVVTAMSDAWICARNNAVQGKVAGHAFMSVVAGLLGAAFFWT